MSGPNPLLAAPGPDDPRTLAAVTLEEMASVARSRMHPSAWDYVDGGTWDETTLSENTTAWLDVRLRPRILVNVGGVDTRTTFLGQGVALPIATAPMAAHALAHPDAEIATARAAAAARIPFTLSTMSSRSIEEVAAAVPDAMRWFQLYAQPDPGRGRALVERAAAAGYGAIMLTVDLPVVGYRTRDLRNGFDLGVPLGNLSGPGSLPAEGVLGTTAAAPDAAAPAGHVGSLRDATLATLTWDDVDAIRGWSALPLLLKGILSARDARLAVEHGVAGIVVGNHGGRQLDRSVTGLAALPDVLAAVDGRCEVWVDGGVRRGLDVAIACALGARGVLIGRPILWGIAGAGEAGAGRVISILRDELERAMALLGAATVADLDPSMVRLPSA